MKKLSKLLYKRYINKNSKILNIDPDNTDWYDYLLSIGHNRFNLISLTTNKDIYELFKSKKYFCIYGDSTYDILSHSIEENEYNLVTIFKDIKEDISKCISEIFWILKDDSYLMMDYKHINYNSLNNLFTINRKYKSNIIFKRHNK